jgi:hypothetical protein
LLNAILRDLAGILRNIVAITGRLGEDHGNLAADGIDFDALCTGLSSGGAKGATKLARAKSGRGCAA